MYRKMEKISLTQDTKILETLKISGLFIYKNKERKEKKRRMSKACLLVIM